MTMRRKSGTAKRGFTLTEIAIVLGIIGLILGAIWVAASAVYNNLRTSKATTELLQIAQAVRSMYATSSTVDAGADMTYSATGSHAAGAGTTYVQSSVFPSDMVSGAGPYIIQDPWAGDTDIVSGKVTTASDSFLVEFDNVPQSACINIITASTGTGRDSSLYGVSVGNKGALAVAAGGTAGTTAMPVTASTAQGLCANVSNNVAFQFKIKG